jgi:hypothetical protein
VLVGHWIGGEAERHRRAHQEWEELAKSGYLECHTTFACRDSNYLIWRRVEKLKKRVEMSSNHGGGGGMKFDFLRFFFSIFLKL